MEEEGTIAYYGQIKCQKENCKNKAYYKNKEEKLLCGVHCKLKDRITLPKLNKKDKEKFDSEKQNQENQKIELAAKNNRLKNKAGSLICTKLRMMKEPESHDGFLKIFPNFKHQNRSDGFGCSSLSPMSLGPVDHGQPGLPPAANIENFHQGTKCFPQEVDKDGLPSELYYQNRLKFYLDPVPHRHKYKGKEKNKNIPLYFVWLDKNNKEHYLNYIESRQFYCNFYERLATQTADFKKLKSLLNDGYNLQICGYDAREINPSEVEQAYLDPSAPFGHELVLFSLLIIDDVEKYPWHKYKSFEF